MDNESKKISDLENCIAIQCDDGNWNYSPYMMGMANGLILAMAILEDKEPDYFKSPDMWIENASTPDKKPITTNG